MRQKVSATSLFFLGYLLLYHGCSPLSNAFVLNKLGCSAQVVRRTGSKVEKAHSIWNGNSCHTTSPLIRRSSLFSVKSGSVTVDYDPFETANDIQPQTMSLPQSIGFYAKFLVKHFYGNRVNKKLQEKMKGKKRAMWKKLDEQRRNVMALAGYTPSLVVPSFLFLFLGALMTSIVPSYYSKCIQCVSTLTTSRSKLVEAMVGLGVTSTLAALFTGLRGSLFWIGGSRANYNVRVKLHRSLLLQEAAFFDMNETGYLLSRLNSDVNKIGQVISYHVNVVLRQFAQFVFGSIYLLQISPKLSLWTFAGISLVAWLSAIYGDLARVLAEKVQDTFADATAVAETSFSMSETIRAFDGAEIESDKFEGAQSRALQLEEVQAWAYGSHKFLSDTLQSILQVAVLFACWNIGKKGGLPAGKLTTFMFYTNFVLESSNEVGDQWAKIQQAIGASSSVFDLIKRAPAIRDPRRDQTSPEGHCLKTNIQASLENTKDDSCSDSLIFSIKDVTVEYEAVERPALANINVDIRPGDRVALVGRSGSGKSSMLRTMMRFYDPSLGSIKLCGKDLREMTRAETASKVAVVAQEPHMFPMTLSENILYGIAKDSVNEETGALEYSEKLRDSVAECLKLAGLSVDPSNELGLSLDTRIGEGGRSLSGGQRQRAAISRALIRSPAVLLLDEPTAALDSESEKLVVHALQKAMERTKSMVMVTHRLGVIRSLGVNRVIVLDKGMIVEDGHPEDLLKNENALYTALAKEQGIVARSNETLAHL